MLLVGFNKALNKAVPSFLNVRDESMISIYYKNIYKGGLYHFSCILRNPGPLGTEFKNVTCYDNEVFTLLEINRGK